MELLFTLGITEYYISNEDSQFTIYKKINNKKEKIENFQTKNDVIYTVSSALESTLGKMSI